MYDPLTSNRNSEGPHHRYGDLSGKKLTLWAAAAGVLAFAFQLTSVKDAAQKIDDGFKEQTIKTKEKPLNTIKGP